MTVLFDGFDKIGPVAQLVRALVLYDAQVLPVLLQPKKGLR